MQNLAKLECSASEKNSWDLSFSLTELSTLGKDY